MNGLALRLAQDDVFKKLPEPECVELAGRALHRRLRKREFLCHQGYLWPNVILLASGKLRVMMLSAGGREYTLLDIKPGEVFWGHSIFDSQPMPASLVAMEDSNVYLWTSEAILTALFRNPEAMWEIHRTQMKLMRRAREIIYGLAFEPVAIRLARLLLGRFAEQDRTTLEREMSLGEIASLVASNPEVVCRLLHQFQTDGILEITRTTIALRDKTALERLTELA
ncbi:MAG: Crp/Fnr family transcriptional regulator [Chloroflexi bacterium]|nr:Crp/Fnr family transcriptional regulator [Chloroflexota bacterium]